MNSSNIGINDSVFIHFIPGKKILPDKKRVFSQKFINSVICTPSLLNKYSVLL